MSTNPDRPLPPEHFDGCPCSWLPIDGGRAELHYVDPDCAIHAPRYLTTLDADERSDR
jgi:hypothetical protein